MAHFCTQKQTHFSPLTKTDLKPTLSANELFSKKGPEAALTHHTFCSASWQLRLFGQINSLSQAARITTQDLFGSLRVGLAREGEKGTHLSIVPHPSCSLGILENGGFPNQGLSQSCRKVALIVSLTLSEMFIVGPFCRQKVTIRENPPEKIRKIQKKSEGPQKGQERTNRETPRIFSRRFATRSGAIRANRFAEKPRFS